MSVLRLLLSHLAGTTIGVRLIQEGSIEHMLRGEIDATRTVLEFGRPCVYC